MPLPQTLCMKLDYLPKINLFVRKNSMEAIICFVEKHLEASSHLLIQLQSLLALPHGLVQGGQVVHRSEGVWMILPQNVQRKVHCLQKK